MRLKIAVSVVRFRPWAPVKSRTYRKTRHPVSHLFPTMLVTCSSLFSPDVRQKPRLGPTELRRPESLLAPPCSWYVPEEMLSRDHEAVEKSSANPNVRNVVY